MVKQTTKYFGIAAALALCLSLTGCESWRRAAPDSPKELPVYSEQMTEPSTEPSTEASDEQPVERENAQALTVGQNSQTKESVWVTAVSITRTSDSAQAFASADEMLSQKAYDLITHQNERFDENFDERVCDFRAEFTDSDGNTLAFGLWVNFQRQNEVIVEDEQKQQWNLSIEDSNHLRAMLTGLG